MRAVFHLSSGTVHEWTHALANVENLLDGMDLVSSGVGELTKRQAEGYAYIKTP